VIVVNEFGADCLFVCLWVQRCVSFRDYLRLKLAAKHEILVKNFEVKMRKMESVPCAHIRVIVTSKDNGLI
jgi:hypothetical protein